MKRQRGRNRGGGGGSGGGGKPQAQNANRAFDSNGPEGSKVRGNAQHVFEKYQQLARDASSARLSPPTTGAAISVMNVQ